MSDSDGTAASDSGIPLEEVTCEDIKIETELDIEPGNECNIGRTPKSIESAGSVCAIEKLLEKPFRSLSYQEKIYYIENDRPTEPLHGLLKPSKGRRNFTRHFNAKSYESVPWLSGCSSLGKLFCWPCLLFCPGKHVWNSTGYEDLNHFHAAVKRHRMSSHHIASSKELKQFIKTRTDFCLSNQFQKSVTACNNEVKKNRKVLSHLVKAVCFLAKQGLLGSNSKSVNESSFVDLLGEFAEYDSELKSILTSSANIPSFFADTLDILISSVCEVVVCKTKENISESPCVAIILDVLTDCNASFLSTSLRFVTRNGVIRETFLGLDLIANDLTPKSLALHILQYLHKFNCEKKLIAYSCDGGLLPPSQLNELEAQVREIHPMARFVNYSAHSLDLVLAQSLAFIKKCKVFFLNLKSLDSFLSRVGARKALSHVPTEREYCSKLLHTLHSHHSNIVDLVASVVRGADSWDEETLCRARGLHSLLEDVEFDFLLQIFSRVFAEVEQISGLLRRNDTSLASKKMDELRSEMVEMERHFDLIWDGCIHVGSDEEPKRKRLDTTHGKSAYKALLTEVMETTLTCLQYRMDKLSGLSFTTLLDARRFDHFKTKFPASQLSALRSNYETHFDFEALKGELTVLCLDKDMHKDTVPELMHYLVSSDLVEIFPEVLKLGAFVLTISGANSSADGAVSHRVRAHVGGRDPLSAMLSIERGLISELRGSTTFTDDVIDVFAKKHGNISLLYKNKILRSNNLTPVSSFREKLQEFLWRLRQPDGSFEMHEGGEVDMRGIYCAVSIARLTNIYTDELFENSAEWIASCQTYEGGFAGCPEMEAHGGYAFCGLAALVLLNKEYLVNMKSFLRWVVNRQMKFEGGFQGRTNKLVDGCYSFWQGGVFPIIHGILSKHDDDNILDHERWMFHQEALQEYILICCQNSSGGLIDKPKKPRDFYHTCYTLSGLSLAQHSGEKCIVLGGRANELSPIHPLYNLVLEAVSTALEYFRKQPVPAGKCKSV